MVEICQSTLPLRPWEDDNLRRMPGLNPTAPGEWLIQDDAYAAQMAHRVGLMQTHEDVVHKLSDGARPAAEELLDTVLDDLAKTEGFNVSDTHVLCPDGREVQIDRDAPLLTCGALVQEDFVLMEKQQDEHVLSGAILCFPASWSLAQKFLKPMVRIHQPVAEYTDDIARRVQRLFDGIQVGRPMWRTNCLQYSDPELHQPRCEEDRRPAVGPGEKWMRVERQGMRRLAASNAVVFSIHTYVISHARLSALGISTPEA